MRGKIVLGSVLGAVAIQVACGSMGPSGDGGLLDAMREAHAGEDGGTACVCPELPKRAESTFAVQLDRGQGAESPLADYSRVAADSTPTLQKDGSATLGLSGNASFYLADRTLVTLACNVTVRPDGTVGPGPVGTCSVGYPGVTAGGQLPVQSVQVTTLTDTTLEFRVPDVSVAIQATGQTLRLMGIVFRSSNPLAQFVTPPRAYRP